MVPAIKDLSQLDDPDFFLEVSTGIKHVTDVVRGLDAAAQVASSARLDHPSRVLDALAKEEASKVFILLDAVRCPRKRSEDRARTLGYFYDHVAKGIYADSANWKPANYAEVQRIVTNLREEFYLDGPYDLDWIFPNQITQHRNSNLYVDYLRDDTESSSGGPRYWSRPVAETGFKYWTKSVVGTALAIDDAGVATPEALAIVAKIWRPFTAEANTSYEEIDARVTQTIHEIRQLRPQNDSACAAERMIACCWPWPLWSLDLRVSKVSKEGLREKRRHWSPH
jgi:AbiV family abortive infection protein